MTTQSEPLAALRAAINERVRTIRGTVLHYVQLHHNPPAYDRDDHAKKLVDAELAAVEARIGRLVRFVTAYDAQFQPFGLPGTLSPEEYYEAVDAMVEAIKAARTAITESDLT